LRRNTIINFHLSRKPYFLLIVLILIPLFLAGCNNNSGDDGGGTGTLTVTHQLENGVPEQVDHFEYVCLDSDGNIIKQFPTLAKDEQHTLEMIPVSTKFLYIAYHDIHPNITPSGANSTFVGDTQPQVDIQSGQRTEVPPNVKTKNHQT